MKTMLGALLLLAVAHLQAEQPDEAIKALRAALMLRPDLTSAQRDIATDESLERAGYVLQGSGSDAELRAGDVVTWRRAARSEETPVFAFHGNNAERYTFEADEEITPSRAALE